MTSSSVTAKDVANWMVDTMRSSGELYQDEAVDHIAAHFGNEFTYENDAGNQAIAREVLREFRVLGGDDIVWMRSDRLWRLREPGDEPGRMQP